MKYIKVNSSVNELKDFKKSIIWADIVRELRSWKEGFKREQASIVDDAATTNPTTASVLLHMGDLNGRQKAVDYLLNLPDIFINIIESQQKENENG